MQPLSDIQFHNDFTSAFPGDDSGNLQPRQTPGMLYSKAVPTPVKKVALIGWSDALAQELEITKPVAQTDIDILGGNQITGSMYPYAACYAGHQFGNWAGQLGDGRAITLGEHITSSGNKYELQLKGAGPTAYSRRADGRAVLRSSVREYLMSEAMHYLGVATTRALSLVSTGDLVQRDMFYDGNPQLEKGAIVMRVAPSFLRFGNFELLAARRENDLLKELVDWTIRNYYPHIEGANKVMDWYKEVLDRTAKLMVEWQRVGFVHGVMNTDNMSILGLTIDYGPYSFVDDYDVNFTPNTTDLPGRRYAFGRQPVVAKWNLACLAGAISPLVNDEKLLTETLDEYDGIYWNYYFEMMAGKLGFDAVNEREISLIDAFEKMLRIVKPDMTIFYQLLISLPMEVQEPAAITHHFEASFYKSLTADQTTLLADVMEKYKTRIAENKLDRAAAQEQMRKHNPRFILRNYLLHEAIEKLDNGDPSMFLQLQEALKQPYSNAFDQYFTKRPEWAGNKAGCSMLSCSS